MRASSHRQLGYFLAQRYLPKLPASYLTAFLTGCTQPDKNPTTYLKGSFRNRWLHGHDYLSAKRYLFRLARRLQCRKNWGMMDYYKLGKLLHYIADAFTYAHSDRFPGGFFAHRRYEQALHLSFLPSLKEQAKNFPPIQRDIAASVEHYHRIYLNTPPSISTDIDYCIGVSGMVMKMLTNPIKSKIFCI